jgi:hypothetical protein
MIIPSYGLTATERVLPSFTLDWTTGLVQSTVDVTRAGVATFVGSNGLIQSASADTQRIDYSTGVAGLLVEESRTNLAVYSEAFGTGWTNVNLTLTDNQIVAPDGNQTAELFTISAAATTQSRQTFSVTSGQIYTLSVFLKAGTQTVIQSAMVQSGESLTTGVRAQFDLSAGTATLVNSGGATVSSGVTSIQSLSNGWYRCVITGTMAFTGTLTVSAVYATSGIVGANNTFSAWGAQLEAGAFATSYIPTEASAVTRNADLVNTTDLSWFNPAQGTLALEFQFTTTLARANASLARLDDGTNNNFIQLGTKNISPNAPPEIAVRYASGTVIRTAGGTNRVDDGAVHRAVGYYGADLGFSLDGIAASTITAPTLPTVSAFRLGSGNTGVTTNYACYFRKFAYYPFAITDRELQAFSK